MREFFEEMVFKLFRWLAVTFAKISISPSKNLTRGRLKLNYIYVGLLWLSYVLVVPAEANPNLDKVVSGDVNIVESGHKMDVIQGTQKAIIDWRSFSIGVDEHTQFHHTNSSAVTLNRVTGVDPSNILGRLSANGNIILINPNGVMFGANSRVDVNSMIATTADIRNEDFLIGKLKFSKAGNPLAKIINQGQITAGESGFIGLIAPSVENSGIIKARLGKVHLAAGDTFTFDMYGDGLMEIAVSDETVKKVVKNSGIVDAAGGEIYITAAAGNNVANSLIEIKGELRAPAVEQRGGKIIIFAEGSNAVKGNKAADKGVRSGESKVIVEAKLDVSGNGEGQTGGDIQVLGDYVGLMYGSALIATGHSGGGEVNVGGDYLGGGNTAAAKNVYVDAGVDIDVSATESGDGGKAIVWSDSATKFYGEILAKGGALSGDGGFVEVSGKDYLEFRGNVDTSAANGNYGELLLDPGEITICQFSGSCVGAPSLTASGNTFNSGSNNGVSYVDIGSVGDTGTLLDLLNSNNVTVRTNANGTGTGLILVADEINSSSSRRLTLRSHGTTRFSDDVTVRNLDIFASDVVIDAGVTLESNNNNGLLRFFQFTNGLSFGIGDGTTGDISFSSQEISQLDNWGRIEFGSNNLTGDINIGDVTFDADLVLRTREDINVTDDITVTTGDYMRFYSNDIDIAGNLSGTNVVELYQQNNNTTMGVGDGAAGTYQLSTAELNRIQDGFSEIRIGNLSNNATMQVAGHTWSDRVRFGNRNGNIDIIGAQNMGANNLTILANNLNIGANLIGTGSLNIRGRDSSRDMILGGNTAGYLSLETAEINRIKNQGWANLIFGHPSSTAAADLDVAALDWSGGSSNVKFFSRDGSVNITGQQTFGDNQNLTIESDNVEIGANVNGGNTLHIFARRNNQDYVIGGNAAGALSLDVAEVNRISNGTWDNLRIGQVDDSNTKTINATSWNGNVEFLSRSGAINVDGAVNSTSGDITFTTRNLNLDAAVSGTGKLTIAPEGNNTMGVGTGQTGTLQLANGDLANIQDGFSEVVFGRDNLNRNIEVGANTWSDDVTFLNRNGEVRFNGDQNLGSNDLKISSNRNVRIDNKLIGTGTLTLQTTSTGSSIGVGGAGGNLNINDADLANIQDGWEKIVIGRTDGTGLLRVDSSSFNDEVILQTGTGQIRVDRDITMAGGNNLTLITNGSLNFTNNADFIGTGTLTFKTQSNAVNIGLAGGAGGVNLTATELNKISDGWGSVVFGDSSYGGTINVGGYTQWKDPTRFVTNSSGKTNINGNQEATGNGALEYSSAVTLGANTSIKAAGGEIKFNETVDGGHNLTLETTGNITFAKAVGAVTALKDIIVTNVNNFIANSMKGDNFTQSAGTGSTTLNGTGLDVSGDVNITNTSGISGTYKGDNGVLKSTGGAINSTVTFNTLDIDSLSANLSAGQIGSSGTINQEMANLISIKGVKFPNLVANSSYKFGGFIIGAKPQTEAEKLRSDTQLTGVLKDIEDGMGFLQENDNDDQDLSGTSFEDVLGGSSCSQLFFDAENCSQRGKLLLDWQK